MSVRSELKQTTAIVMEMLQKHPETRNSDDVLYCYVCEEINPQVVNVSFRTVLANRKRYGLPAFESVRRTRQKAQACNPELAAVADVEAGRMIREEEFRDFARSY